MKLEANGIVAEPAARQACPPDRVFALLDPLLSRAALIVERNHPLGGAAQVGDNEPDPRVRQPNGRIAIYGANFSLTEHRLRLDVRGASVGPATVEHMTDKQVHRINWDGRSLLLMPPMTLWRVAL